ncbi:divergent polysaccharide deacetylase family protein [Ferrimonas sp. SCSIO 43195]|uniref:divergent polysaccharide deacetylase family protein n=1 Tax=Ferrimonas sp. SCSIO 43195 TaxID=2822844 RepID=UPI0020760458|nr:divergent polysaccharide deacetylase family protein [Ferrimonas sp. SCSIO 43195]USD37559.1 divergent polysaccharide deacetylase family protein [Ferrimonas sp. SCSIO 43195]
MGVATGSGVTIKQIVAAVLLCCSTLATAAELSLIIDDVGYRHTDHRVLNLPAGTTLSVLPHTPWGRQLAVSGWRQGHEIMLHLPMLAEAGNALGPSALLPGMSQWQVQLTIKRALADVPFVRGVNNHMGSELTRQRPMMDKVMTELAERKLFFVDSLTTPESVAYDSAAAHGIPALKRHVFLDNETQDVDLNRQFEQALTIAQKYGKAVLIGHPYPETLSYLERNLSRLPEMGIRLVPTSTLLSDRQRQWMRPVQPPTAYLHKLPAPVPSASP